MTTFNWTWIKGADAVNDLGHYGTLGVMSTSDNPRSRFGGCPFPSIGNKFYLFGGNASSGNNRFNDLWCFDISDHTWTWIKGLSTLQGGANYGTINVSASSNIPDARQFPCCWMGQDGQLYMFGGRPDNTFVRNDLWRFNLSDGNWTWIKGPNTTNDGGSPGTQGVSSSSNIPGSRDNACCWTGPDGRLYLFGGNNLHNDLWCFNISDNNWTWIKGRVDIVQNGVYGTKNLPASDNTPGARQLPCCWTGLDGYLYLFGGTGRDAVGNSNNLNDLWRFNLSDNNWTWLKGSNTINQNGIYASDASVNTPGARQQACCWTGVDGNLYLFGGTGLDQNGTSNILNDLWCFNLATQNWLWIKGASVVSQNGGYGTLDVASDGNQPGSRRASHCWVGADNKFYLFGGSGLGRTTATVGRLDDLWMGQLFLPCSIAISDFHTTPAVTCANTPFTVSWKAITVGGSDRHTATITFNGNTYVSDYMNTSGSMVLTAPAIASDYVIELKIIDRAYSDCTDTKTTTISIKDIAVDAGADRTIIGGNSTQLGAGTAAPNVAYLWSPGGMTSLTPTVSPLFDTTYTVVATRTDVSDCVASDSVNVHVLNTKVVFNTPPVTVVSGNTYKVAGSVTGAIGGYTITADVDGVNTPVTTSDSTFSLQATFAGATDIVTVKAVDAFGYSDTKKVQVFLSGLKTKKINWTLLGSFLDFAMNLPSDFVSAGSDGFQVFSDMCIYLQAHPNTLGTLTYNDSSDIFSDGAAIFGPPTTHTGFFVCSDIVAPGVRNDICFFEISDAFTFCIGINGGNFDFNYVDSDFEITKAMTPSDVTITTESTFGSNQFTTCLTQISDFTVPVSVVVNQPFTANWHVNTIGGSDHHIATISFNSSDFTSAYPNAGGAQLFTAPAIASDYPITLFVQDAAYPDCSDLRTILVHVIPVSSGFGCITLQSS